ncbi:MAG: acetyl-CoA carboxylase biotin carboxyl carrier protein subunit, partial [Caldimonas sp.]
MNPQKVRAPMAATVVEIRVAPGQRVHAGQGLVIVEAMKMEHELCAEADAEIVSVDVRAGDSIDEGDVLLQWAAPA